MEAEIKEAIKEAHRKKPNIILSPNDIYTEIFKAGVETETKRVTNWLEYNAPESVWNCFTAGHDVRNE